MLRTPTLSVYNMSIDSESNGPKELIKIFNLFSDNASITIFGLELTWFVLLAVCALLIISACIVGVALFFYRRNQAGAEDQIRSKDND